MLLETDEKLDQLIHEEKQKVALEFFQEAWRAAVEEGIEAGILADSAIVTALTELQKSEGEQQVSSLLDTLPPRFNSGHFDESRILQ